MTELSAFRSFLTRNAQPFREERASQTVTIRILPLGTDTAAPPMGIVFARPSGSFLRVEIAA